jgi:hypothetical protein
MEAGYHVTEIEVTEVVIEHGHKKIFEHLRELAATSRVDIANKARLTKK